MRTVVTTIERPDVDLVTRFARLYTGLALDQMGKQGAMSGVDALSPGMRVCGPAVTCLGLDLTVRRAAIDLARPGDVLVVAAGGHDDVACFGDGTATRMMTKGMAGAVLDACTRDAAGIRRLGFPTFCRGTTARNLDYPAMGDVGAVNVPIVCAGVAVSPGDLVLGDDDGVVVVPRGEVPRVLEAAEAKLAEETAERSSWVEYPPFGALEELRRRGYTIR